MPRPADMGTPCWSKDRRGWGSSSFASVWRKPGSAKGRATAGPAGIAAALDAFGKDGTTRVLAMGVQASASAPETRLLVRGELDKPAQVVKPGVLQVLAPRGASAFPASAKVGGRMEYAEWIASPRNPLTARVIVNRAFDWGRHADVGLCACPRPSGFYYRSCSR